MTPISSTITHPAEILFERKPRSILLVLPLQLLNPRIPSICQQLVCEEGKFYSKEQISTLDEVLEPGQLI